MRALDLRRSVSLLIVTLVAIATVQIVAATPAHARWWTGFRLHGGEVQLCKTPLSGGRFQIKLRLDNRRASHAHVGGLSRTRGGQTTSVDVRVGGGKISTVKSLVWTRGDRLSAGIGETSGEGFGDTVMMGDLTRC